MAELIKMSFVMWSPVGQKKHVLDGVHIVRLAVLAPPGKYD